MRTVALLVTLAGAVIAAPLRAHADAETWVYRASYFSMIGASDTPHHASTFTLVLDGTDATLTVQVQNGQAASGAKASGANGVEHGGTYTWTAVPPTQFKGTVLRDDDLIAIDLGGAMLACKRTTARVAAANATRAHAGGESDSGRWVPAATTAKPALECLAAGDLRKLDSGWPMTFAITPGVEQLFVTNSGRGLRAIPKDGSIAPPL